MLGKIRIIIKQKGQGIVEYALLLAFVVSVAMMLNGTNLGGAVKGAYDNVAALLVGENTITDWAHAKKNTFNDSNSAARLASDQQALAKIGEFFLGKTKQQVKAMIKEHRGANDAPVILGYFSLNDDEGSQFTAGQLNDNLATNVYDWMTGTEGAMQNNGSDYKYLVSDYVMNNEYQSNAGNQTTGGVGIRIQYNGDDANAVATGVKVAVDYKNQGTISNGYTTEGLEVMVKKEGDTTKTYYNKNTGLSDVFSGN